MSRVLVVTPWLPTAASPQTGIFVARDIAALAALHDVSVLHLASGEPALPVSGVTMLEPVPMRPSDPRTIRAAAERLRNEFSRFDVVHTMAASALLPFLFVTPPIPWVHSEHWSSLRDARNESLIGRLSLPVVRRLLQKPDLVISVGQELDAAVRRTRGGPTRVIPNLVEVPTVLAPRPEEETLKLLSVGGLVPGKGPEVAVQAVAELRAHGVRAHLDWLGDGPLRETVQRLAREIGVADAVTLHGNVAPAEVGDYLAAADIFVLPTQGETFGVAIAEALVAGRPVVVGARGEHANFVAPPDGELVPEHTGTAFAEAILRVRDANRGRDVHDIGASARVAFTAEARKIALTEAYEFIEHARRPRGEVRAEIVIAVHDPRRDIARAVRSVLTSARVARAIVVCHNTPADGIQERLGTVSSDPRVLIAELQDGVRSPAGPFNHGLDLAREQFVGVMGSDDELEAGAVDSWLERVERDDADAVIAPLRYAGGARVATPPTRPLRRRALDAVRDRLAYRTAPLGIYRRDRWSELRMTEGLATGEDLAFSTRLWFSGARISGGGAHADYLIHDDAERVTFATRPIRDDLAAVVALVRDTTLTLAPTARRSLAVKLWRINIFGAVHYRAGAWRDDDRASLAACAKLLRDYAPGAVSVLSRAEKALLDLIVDETSASHAVDAASRRRRRFLSVAALVPHNPLLLFARDAPLRFSAATVIASRR